MKSTILLLICTVAVAAQDKVKVESVTVYGSRDTKSPAVKTLAKGAELTVDMSITGEDGAQWCTIRETGQKDRLGYVHCDTLDRPVRASKAARRVTATATAPEAPAGPIKRVGFGANRWMGYGDLIASTFKFTPQQRAQVEQIAKQNGIPTCIQNTDSYKGPGRPPDILPTSPVTPCHWYAQTFYEQVFALATAEQLAADPKSQKRIAAELAKAKATIAARPQAKAN